METIMEKEPSNL